MLEVSLIAYVLISLIFIWYPYPTQRARVVGRLIVVLGIVLLLSASACAISPNKWLQIDTPNFKMNVDNPLVVYAYQCNGVLEITTSPLSGKLSQVVISCDPKPTGYTHRRGSNQYLFSTTATEGHFSAILCENNRCTPVETYFYAAVYDGKTPTPASVDTPTPWGAYVFFGAVICFFIWVIRHPVIIYGEKK